MGGVRVRSGDHVRDPALGLVHEVRIWGLEPPVLACEPVLDGIRGWVVVRDDLTCDRCREIRERR